jgi:microcin C transport system substrate-binding protein
MGISRRTILKLAGLTPLAKFAGVPAAIAQDRQFRHALTLFDDIKYGPDFKNFDYVNPAAPKGGKVRLSAVGSFDSLNPYTFKGDSVGVAGNETLLTSSLDEPSTEYGLIAESVWFPEDWSSVVYRLRPEARFHDGKPITPEDVVWSMTTLKEINPAYNGYYKNVVKAEKTGEHEVTFTFSEKGNRELPLITGQLPVLPMHWWTGKDANGRQRDIRESTMEVPLGSGPYTVVDVKSGASIRLKRVEDYWGKDLPVNIGQNNIDEVEYIFFRDANVQIEAFKGDQYDYRAESSAKYWATFYDFPAIKDGRCIKEEIHLKGVEGMQSFALNLRREKFQDVRVRKALNYAFDFEWANANLFYGQYTRSRSFFNNSVMEAKGLPSPEELALLEPLKDQLPAEVFTTEYANPVSNNSTERRKNLREASKLLAEAGWNVTQDGNKSVLKNAKGERLEVEFLLDSPLFERIALPYQQQLELLGIGVRIKTVDGAQYERQTQNFDYDIMVGSWGQSLSPGNEQRDFWGSASADKKGSRNFVGIMNPAIDKLIDEVIFSKDRAGLTTACKALDRALIWNHYLVPMWFIPYERTARWDRFGKPDKLPDYAIGFPTIWWWDEEKAKKVEKG